MTAMTVPKYLKGERIGDVLVVTPYFTHKSFTEPLVLDEWKQIAEELERPEVKHAVVDLGEIAYFGSTVLEWMVTIWKTTKSKDGRFAVCCLSDVGKEILTVARLNTVWIIADSRADAINAIRGV
jgi:anti-anti-sigma factor